MNIKSGHIWYYAPRDSRYYVEEIGEMKIGDGEWVESVVYTCLESDKTYTRDTKTFLEKFVFENEGEPKVKLSQSEFDLGCEQRAELRILLKEKEDEILILKQCLEHTSGFAQGLIEELKKEIEDLKGKAV